MVTISYAAVVKTTTRNVSVNTDITWRHYETQVKKLNTEMILSPRLILKHRLNLYRIGSAKIKGKESSNTIHQLSVNDRDVSSHRDIANALADTFSYNSSSAFSTDAFASVRKKAEKQNINCSSDNAEVYSRRYPDKTP